MSAEVAISLVGLMRKPQDQGEHRLDHHEGMTVSDALVQIGYRPDELGYFSLLIDNRPTGLGHALRAGEHLIVCLPLGGG